MAPMMLVLLPGVASAASDTAASVTSPAMATVGSGDAEELLRAMSAAARRTPHVGAVTVVTFTPDGPRVAELDVRVGALGDLELRRPTRWLLGAGNGAWLRTAEHASALSPVSAAHALDVTRVLRHWTATVGPPRQLDTGPATPVHLVRRDGTVIEEVLYVDALTSLPVRRETRTEDGSVLRVVAYTAMSPVAMPSPGRLRSVLVPGDVPDAEIIEDVHADGFMVPDALAGGFELMEVEHEADLVVARYGDGLSVLSVYQQQGRLDSGALDGARIVHMAGRDVWTWPGTEPLRVVWTSGEHTWTSVTDAPLEVVEDALVSLPGDLVGHDVPSRIRRGIDRVWSWARSAFA